MELGAGRRNWGYTLHDPAAAHTTTPATTQALIRPLIETLI